MNIFFSILSMMMMPFYCEIYKLSLGSFFFLFDFSFSNCRGLIISHLIICRSSIIPPSSGYSIKRSLYGKIKAVFTLVFFFFGSSSSSLVFYHKNLMIDYEIHIWFLMLLYTIWSLSFPSTALDPLFLISVHWMFFSFSIQGKTNPHWIDSDRASSKEVPR